MKQLTIDLFGNFIDKHNPYLPIIDALERDSRVTINIMGPVHKSLLHIQKRHYVPGSIAFGMGTPREISGMHMGDYKYKMGYTSWETTKIPYGSYYGLEKSLQELDLLYVPDKHQAKLFKDANANIKILPMFATINKSNIHPINHYGFTFLCIGKLTLKANIGYLIAATMQIAQDYPEVKLILKTDSGTLGHLRFPNNIEVIDETLTQRQIIDLYNMADCYVYPTSTDPMPINYYNAINLGLPTIAPSHSGFDKKNLLTDHTEVQAERYSRKLGDVGNYWSVNYRELHKAMVAAVQGQLYYGNSNDYSTPKDFIDDIITIR